MNNLNQSQILLIGYDSYIGGEFAKHWKLMSLGSLLKTSRQPTSLDVTTLDLPYVDSYPEAIDFIKNSNVIVFLAGISAASYINSFPIESRNINLLGLTNVIKESRKDCKFIYLSSSRCFDGNSPNYSSLTPPCPIDEYGYQKSNAEKLILSQRPKSAVVRLSKVINPHEAFFRKSLSALKIGEPVFASKLKFVSPLSSNIVSKVITHIIKEEVTGLLHFSPLPYLSYFTLLNEIADFYNLPKSLIREQIGLTPLHKYDSLQSSDCFSAIGTELSSVIEETFGSSIDTLRL